MTRLDAMRALVRLVDDEVLVSNLGKNTYDLYIAGDRPRNFYTWGAMGTVSSVGLGLALARPDLRVVVLDGDGSRSGWGRAPGKTAIDQERCPSREPFDAVLPVWDHVVHS